MGSQPVQRSCCVHPPPCAGSAGDAFIDEGTSYCAASRPREEIPRPTRQTDYHRCSVSSSNTLDYVGTVPLTLSASGKSPTMPRALCAFALSLAVLNSRAFDLRAPAECRAASERESPTPLPIASSWPLGSPCYLRCGHYCCWL